MTKRVIVVSDRLKNNISVYTEESAVVVTAGREDMNSLRTLPEANHAGVYLLINENKRYIGQASSSVYDRLVQHDKNKDWWTKVIFFGRVDGRLDKSQTDYLEQLLIKRFESTSFVLENKTLGNTSYIDQASRIHADNVWYYVQKILKEMANIDIFESLIEREEELPRVVREKEFVIKDNNGHEFKSKSARANYIDFIRHYFQSEQYKETVSHLIIDGKPTTRYILGTKKNVVPSGQLNSVELSPNVHLYATFSTKDRRKAVQRFAKSIGIQVEIIWLS